MSRAASRSAERLARWRADRMAFRREAVFLEEGRAFGEVMATLHPIVAFLRGAPA